MSHYRDLTTYALHAQSYADTLSLWSRPRRGPSLRTPPGEISDPTGDAAADRSALEARTAARQVLAHLRESREWLEAMLIRPGLVSARLASLTLPELGAALSVEAASRDDATMIEASVALAADAAYEAMCLGREAVESLDPPTAVEAALGEAKVAPAEPTPARPTAPVHPRFAQRAVEAVQQHEPMLRRWAAHDLRGSGVSVDDVLQETYLIAAEAAGRRSEPGAQGKGFAAAMYRAARQRLLSRQSAQPAPRGATLPENALGAWSPAVESDLAPETVAALEAAIAALPDRQRVVAAAVAAGRGQDLEFLRDVLAAVDGTRPSYDTARKVRDRTLETLRGWMPSPVQDH